MNYHSYPNLEEKLLSLSDEERVSQDSVRYHNYRNSLLNSIFLKVEYFFTYFALLFCTDALSFRSLFLSGEGAEQTTYMTPIDPLIGLTRYAIYTFTIVMIILRFKMIFPIILRSKSLLILTAIAYLSCLWSDLPEFTTYYGTFAIGTTLFGIYFAGRYSFSEQLKFLAWVLGTIAIMCFFFTLLLPGAGIEQGIHSGAWRGVFWHKNNLGRYATLGTIIFSLMAQTNQRFQKLLWFFCSLSVCLLILSASKTALIVFVVSLGLLYLCYILSWDNILSVPIFLTTFLVSCGVTFWVIKSLDKILVVLGKGITLSGRTDIWNAVMTHIWQRPYWGYGYSAFWLQEGQARYIWSDIGFQASHAHNGFLDLILELGFVGLSLFLISFVVVYAQSLILLRRAKSVTLFFPLLFFSFFLMYNFSGSQVLEDGSLTWVIYITLAFSLEDLLNPRTRLIRES